MEAKRKLKLAVISDAHLGTYGSKAPELLQYLQSIRPEVLVLNGDILDLWQFSKNYFPHTHLLVLKEILGMMEQGIRVYYITGNHDEDMRKFVGTKIGQLSIENKVLLELDGQKAWFFHGDVFDITMQHSKWLAKLGAKGYGMLILINKFVNFTLQLLGKKKISLSKRIKDGVTHAVKSKTKFEQTAADIAIDKGYQYVVCGHIHRPEIKWISNGQGKVCYLNSGDWVENMTALEYDKKVWKIYRHTEDYQPIASKIHVSADDYSNKSLFEALLKEFVVN